MGRKPTARNGDAEEPLDLIEPLEDQDPPDDEGEADEDDEAEEGEFSEDDEEAGEGDGADDGQAETIVTFEDEPDKEAGEEGDDGGPVIRRIRERNKELARENLELRKAASAAAPVEDLGPKPTIAGFDYDEAAFEEALDEWKERKAKTEQAKVAQEAENERANREWQQDMVTYAARRDALALPDFEDSAEACKSMLNLAQQAVIVKAARDPAALVYALGRSDGRLAELAKIQDPIKFAAAIARMEGGTQSGQTAQGTASRPAPQGQQPDAREPRQAIGEAGSRS